jgi:predicted RNase H-like nuclease (RuvC/YqgF family)
MQKRYTIQEYADKMQVNASTVYRWSQQGKLTTEKIDGVLHVIVDDEKMQDETAKMQNYHGVDLQSPSLIITDMIAEMKERIESLEEENKEKNRQIENLNLFIQQMQQDAEAAKQRSDTIILQLTRQFEEQTKLIEDMRHRSMWSRVKTMFGFAPS